MKSSFIMLSSIDRFVIIVDCIYCRFERPYPCYKIRDAIERLDVKCSLLEPNGKYNYDKYKHKFKSSSSYH